jgi:hypothetical protein
MRADVRRYGVAMVLLAAVAAAVTLAAPGMRNSASAKNAAARKPAAVRVAPALAKSLRVLRDASRAAEPIPARWRNQIAASGNAAVDLNNARRIELAPGKGTHWVAAGTQAVCLLNQSGDGATYSCATPQELQAGMSISTDSGTGLGLGENQVRVNGLLPDGISNARLTMADGSSQPVTVVDNVYAVVVTDERPVRLEWADARGTAQSVRVPMG